MKISRDSHNLQPGGFALWQRQGIAVLLVFTVFFLDFNAPTQAVSLQEPQLAASLESVKIQENKTPAAISQPGLASLTIPEYLGSLRVLQPGNPDQSVVILQDAHGQISAQKSLHALLRYLADEYGFQTVFIEGAVPGPLSPDLLRFFKDENANRRVADLLFREGRIGGPDLFVFEEGSRPDADASGQPTRRTRRPDVRPDADASGQQTLRAGRPVARIQAFGMDDPKLYFNNLLHFRRVYAWHQKSESFLGKLKVKLNTAASRHLNPALRDFVREWLAFQDSRQEIMQHLTVLRRYADRHLGMDLQDIRHQLEYPQLVRFFQLRKTEEEIRKSLDETALAREKEELFAWLQRSGLRNTSPEFFKLAAVVAADTPPAQIPANVRRVLEDFDEEARPFGFVWTRYPELSRLFSQTVLSQELNGLDLYDEVDRITKALTKKLAKSKEESAIMELYGDYLTAGKLFRLELTREEFQATETRERTLRPESLTQRMDALIASAETGFVPPESYPFRDLERLFNEAVGFYRTAVAREETMLRTILDFFENGKRPAKVVFVAGGFHTDGIVKGLTARKISVAGVTPHMDTTPPPSGYSDQMMLAPRREAQSSGAVQSMLSRMALAVMARHSPRDAQAHAAALRRILESLFPELASMEPGAGRRVHGLDAEGNLTAAATPEDDRSEARSPQEEGFTGYDLNRLQYLITRVRQNSNGDAAVYAAAAAGRLDEMAQQAGLGPDIQSFDDLPDNMPSERKDTLRRQANPKRVVHGLVKNAQDWNAGPDGQVAYERQSGEHLEGAMRFLGQLRPTEGDVRDYAVLESRRPGESRGFRAWFWNVGTREQPRYLIHYEIVEDIPFKHGTQIKVVGDIKAQESLQHLYQSVRVNTLSPIRIRADNKTIVANDPQAFHYLGPEGGNIVAADRKPVDVAISASTYVVRDPGAGMSLPEFFERFLVPNETIKEQRDQAREAYQVRDVKNGKLFSSTKVSDRTVVEEWVNGHRIQSFDHPEGISKLNVAERLMIDFPVGTPYPNDESRIKLEDDAAIDTLNYLIGRLTVDPVTNAIEEVPERFAKINALAIYIRHKLNEEDRRILGDRNPLLRLRNGVQAYFAARLVNGRVDGKIPVPNAAAVPDTPDGWRAFDHEQFLPVDEDLFDPERFHFQFAAIETMLEPLGESRRKALLNEKTDPFPEAEVYLARWPFPQDQVQHGVVTWILNDEGRPVILIDPAAYEKHKAQPYWLEQLFMRIAPEIKALIQKSGFERQAKPEVETQERGWLAWLKKWWPVALVVGILAAIAGGIWALSSGDQAVTVEAPGGDDAPDVAPDVRPQPDLSPEAKAKLKTALDEAVTKKAGAKKLQMPPVKPQAVQPGAVQKAPPKIAPQLPPGVTIPKIQKPQNNKPQAVQGEDGSVAGVRQGGGIIVNLAERDAAQRGNLGIRPTLSGLKNPFASGGADRYLSGPSPTDLRRLAQLKQIEELKRQGLPVDEQKILAEPPSAIPDEYGFIQNAIPSGSFGLEPMVVSYYPEMDSNGAWIRQPLVRKTLKDAATQRLNQDDIQVSMQGYAQEGVPFVLYNYVTGLIPDAGPDGTPKIKVEKIDGDGNVIGAMPFERTPGSDVLVFKETGTVRVSWTIDYYPAEAIAFGLPKTKLPANEAADLEKYFANILREHKDKSTQEKIRFVLNFVGEHAVYDITASAKQGALSRPGYHSWTERVAQIMGMTDDTPLVLENKAKVICNSSCVMTSLLLNALDVPTTHINLVIPTAAGVFDQSLSGHSRTMAYVKETNSWVALETTAVLDQQTTPYDPTLEDAPEPALEPVVVPEPEVTPEDLKKLANLQDVRDRLAALQAEGLNADEVQQVDGIIQKLTVKEFPSEEEVQTVNRLLEKFREELKARPAKAAEMQGVIEKLERESSQFRALREGIELDRILVRMESFFERSLLSKDAHETLLAMRRNGHVLNDELYRLGKELESLGQDSRYTAEMEAVVNKLKELEYRFGMVMDEDRAIGDMIERLEKMATDPAKYGLQGKATPEEIQRIRQLALTYWNEGSHALSKQEIYDLNQGLDFLADLEKQHWDGLGKQARESLGDPVIEAAIKRLTDDKWSSNEFRAVRERRAFWTYTERIETLTQSGALEGKVTEEESELLRKYMAVVRDSGYGPSDQKDQVLSTLLRLARDPETAAAFRDVLQELTNRDYSIESKHRSLLTEKDYPLLLQDLIRLLDGTVPESEIVEFSEKFQEHYKETSKKPEAQLFDLVKTLGSADPETRREAFNEEVSELNQDLWRDQSNWWFIVGFIAFFGGIVSLFIGFLFYSAVADEYKGIRERLKNQNKNDRRQQPYRGHYSPFDAAYDGWRKTQIRKPGDVPAVVTQYGVVTDATDAPFERAILPVLTNAEGDWDHEKVRKQPFKDAQPQGIPAKIKLRAKVKTNQAVDLYNYTRGLIDPSSLRVSVIQEDGTKVPLAGRVPGGFYWNTNSRVRIGPEVAVNPQTKEAEIEIEYTINHYTGSQIQLTVPIKPFPDAEITAARRYFGDALDKEIKELTRWDTVPTVTPSIRIMAVNEFFKKHVVLDLTATEETGALHTRIPIPGEPDGFHGSWAQAAGQRFQRGEIIRVNTSILVTLKAVLLATQGIPTARVAMVEGPGQGETRLTTETDASDQLLVGVPAQLPQEKEARLKAHNQNLERFNRLGARVKDGNLAGIELEEGTDDVLYWMMDPLTQNLNEDVVPVSRFAMFRMASWQVLVNFWNGGTGGIATMLRYLFYTPWIVFRFVLAVAAYFGNRAKINRVMDQLNIPSKSRPRVLFRKLAGTLFSHNTERIFALDNPDMEFAFLDALQKNPDWDFLRTLFAYHRREQGEAAEIAFLGRLLQVRYPDYGSSMSYTAGYAKFPELKDWGLKPGPLPDFSSEKLETLEARSRSWIDGGRFDAPEYTLSGDLGAFSPLYAYLENVDALDDTNRRSGEQLIRAVVAPEPEAPAADPAQVTSIFVMLSRLQNTIGRWERESHIPSYERMLPRLRRMRGRILSYAANEFRRSGNLESTREVVAFLMTPPAVEGQPAGEIPLNNLWMFEADDPEAVERNFPYPARGLIELFLGYESLEYEEDLNLEDVVDAQDPQRRISRSAAPDLFTDEIKEWLDSKDHMNLAWLVDAARDLQERDADVRELQDVTAAMIRAFKKSLEGYILGKKPLKNEAGQVLNLGIEHTGQLNDHPLYGYFNDQCLGNAGCGLQQIAEQLAASSTSGIPAAEILKALKKAFREEVEPVTRGDVQRAISIQEQPGLVMLRELIQNARDIVLKVPDSRLAVELARTGGKRQVRVRTFLTQTEADKTHHDASGALKPRLRYNNTVEDGYGMSPYLVIQKYFPPKATTKSAGETVLLTLRDNDAAAATDLIFHTFVNEASQNDTALRAQIEALAAAHEDMEHPEEAILKALEGHRRVEPASAGIFGVGNYTVYHDADEMILRTSYGGKLLEVHLRPIREIINNKPVVVDVEILSFKSYEDPHGDFKGTRIQTIRYFDAQDETLAHFEDRKLKYLFAKYIGAVDNVEIVFVDANGEPRDIQIQDTRTPIAAYGRVQTLTSKMKIPRVTVDQLYIQDPGDLDLFAYVPSWGRDWIRANSINFEFQKGTYVTEARSEILEPAEYHQEVGVASMKTFAAAWRKGELAIEGLPVYRDFLRDPRAFHQGMLLDEEILKDAAALNQNKPLSAKRWRFYLQNRQAYAALLVHLNLEEAGGKSTYQQKTDLFFGHLPKNLFQAGYRRSAPLRQQLDGFDVAGLAGLSDEAFQKRAAAFVMTAVARLYAQRRLTLPGIPSFETYVAPQTPVRTPQPAVTEDLARIAAGDWDAVDFTKYQSGSRFFDFIVAVPLSGGESINHMKNWIQQQTAGTQTPAQPGSPPAPGAAAAPAGTADVTRLIHAASGTLGNERRVRRNDARVFKAFSAFLDRLTAALDRLPGERYRHLFEFDRLEWDLTEDGDLLTVYAAFLDGVPAGDRIFDRILDKMFKGEQAARGVAGETRGLEDDRKMFYAALLVRDTISDLRASAEPFGDISGSISKVRQKVKEETDRGRPFIFEYERTQDRPEARSGADAERLEARILEEEEDASAVAVAERPLSIGERAIPAETALEPAAATPRKPVSRETRRRVAQVTNGVLATNEGPEDSEALLAELVTPEFEGLSGADAVRFERLQNSTQLTTVISVVPFDLTAEQMEAYVDGVLAGLNQTQRTHEVIVLVQGGKAQEQPEARFEQEFKQVAGPKIQNYRIEQPRNLFTKIHFVDEKKFADSASMLLLQRDEIVLAAASSYQPGIALPENARRVMTDQLYNPERGAQPLDMPLTDTELRDYLGTFVTASFEAVLTPGEEISEDTRLLLQDEDERWYARNMDALTNTQAFVTAMLQQTRLTSISA